MSMNYNEAFPNINFVHDIHEPERWLKRYVVISTRVFAFFRDAKKHYNDYYSIFPHTQVIGFPVRGNCTTNFFIVMDKSWWDLVKRSYNGDLNLYYQFLSTHQEP